MAKKIKVKLFELSHDSKPNVPDQITDENREKFVPFRLYILKLWISLDQPWGAITYPDIIECNLNNYNFKYMVICSDGVW